MSRRALIAGNWKMHKTPQETEAFIASFLSVIPSAGAADLLLIPPFTSLDRAGRLLAGSEVALGAQDLHEESSGAFTGAVSGEMVRDAGCTYVLVGHSERRALFHDDDHLVGRKLQAALSAGLRPILCVGETLDERRAGSMTDVLVRQLSAGLEGLSSERMGEVTVAYEPVWAIGTGETATPAQAQEATAWIRTWLAECFDDATAQTMRILYGGSVKPANAAELLSQPDVDGGLVGGASLDPEAFASIAAAAQSASTEDVT